MDVANTLYIWGHWPLLIGGGVLLYHLSRPHLAAVRDQWHSLDAADQEEASQAARELLDEIGAQLRAAGYDDAHYFEAFTSSGGDLHAALAVTQALGTLRPEHMDTDPRSRSMAVGRCPCVSGEA